MIWMTLGQKLRALNAVDDSGLGPRRTTLGRELKALNAIDDSRS